MSKANIKDRHRKEPSRKQRRKARPTATVHLVEGIGAPSSALKSEIEDLKEGIRELIDAVEDLSTAKGNVAITTPSEEALKRFGRRIEGLKQHFKTEDDEKEGI